MSDVSPRSKGLAVDQVNQTSDFWQSSGFHLLARDEAGRLVVTDDFLRVSVVGGHGIDRMVVME